MAAPASLSALLDSLTQSLSSASETAPKVASIEQSTNGISLLDVKNELLLSYLQNLVFLILLKLRNAKNATPDAADPTQEVVKKLVELRLYIEKGVRPLEDKLRYQIEKILRAADDTERAAQVQVAKAEVGDNSDSGSDSGDDDDEDDGEATASAQAGNFSARPGSFVRPAAASAAAASAQKDGVYRPPRVAPTVMPSERRERKDRRPQKSATMDEFIEAEMSSVPMAVPSIGTNVLAGGRKIKTAAERKDEDERREYEESNFTRLPTASKKDKAKAAQQSARGRMQFGGEEWRDLREGVDRINRLTAKKEGARGTRALLEKSRKRGRETTDGPKSDGTAAGMGDRFQKRLKVVEGGRRDRGGNRK
ncbi:Sas10/Utp3/C1D family protein [Plectosphaerella cucumerina]|uniref:Sas10/Utp3/C1D family protein n=1 Tax=Plectosphaerella cucumerina TaxID=40658 RepID=A0A8K0TMU4_9PEZI|nr:Sas10/Utp3/C1D family protein [Plectosphaerella cucumerina]